MEIKPFIVDEEGVKKRAQIKPFGVIKEGEQQKYSKILDKPPTFKTSDDVDMEEEDNVDTQAYVFKAKYTPIKQNKSTDTNFYVAPSKRQEQVSVKITNLPLDIDRRKLESIIMDKFELVPLSTHVVCDREKGESRGYAYVAFASHDAAKHASDKINGYVIEHQILGAEIAKS